LIICDMDGKAKTQQTNNLEGSKFKYLHNTWTLVIIVVAHHYRKQNSQNQSANWRKSIATNFQLKKKTNLMRKSPYLSQVYFSIFHSLSHTNYYMFLKKIDVVDKHLC
jgi:hypothetical protein